MSDKANACPHCGKPLTDYGDGPMLHCSECGTNFPAQEDICPSCGTPKEECTEITPEGGSAPGREYPDKANGHAAWKHWAVALIVLAVAGGAAWHYLRHGDNENLNPPMTDSVDYSVDYSADTDSIDSIATDSVACESDWTEDVSEEEGPSWIQGTWTARVTAYGNTSIAKIVISGTYASFYSDGDLMDQGTISINGSRISFGNSFIDMDESRQLLMLEDGHYMTHGENPSGNYRATSEAEDEEMRTLTRLKELGEEGRELLNELAAMRNSGRMDPLRLMYIQRNCIRKKDEQISLARELGDRQMVSEYQQQKAQLIQAFRAMDNGY